MLLSGTRLAVWTRLIRLRRVLLTRLRRRLLLVTLRWVRLVALLPGLARRGRWLLGVLLPGLSGRRGRLLVSRLLLLVTLLLIRLVALLLIPLLLVPLLLVPRTRRGTGGLDLNSHLPNRDSEPCQTAQEREIQPDSGVAVHVDNPGQRHKCSQHNQNDAGHLGRNLRCHEHFRTQHQGSKSQKGEDQSDYAITFDANDTHSVNGDPRKKRGDEHHGHGASGNFLLQS